MTLQQKIREDMVASMKAKDEVPLRVLRSLISLFTQELTATKRTPQDTLSDDEVISLLRRSLKQRHEAALQYRHGNREDLAKNEEEEAKVLEDYLPAQMSEDEVRIVVMKKKEELGIVDKSGLGKLVGSVMAEFKGKADGKLVKELAENIFA